MYRGAMVGAGYWSERQLAAWEKVEKAKIVALCDLDEPRLDARASQFGIKRTYIDARTMITNEKLDFLDIVTRPSSHRELVKLAASQGLHILCQKSLGATMSDCKYMVAKCNQEGVRLMVNDQWRWQGWFIKVKELLDLGEIGEPFLAQMQHASRATIPQFIDHGQSYFREMEQLIIFEFGVHCLDMARFLFGETNNIYALTRQMGKVSGEDVALIVARFENTIFVLKETWAAVPVPELELPQDLNTSNVMEGNFHIQGTRGSAIIRPNGQVDLYTDEENRSWVYPENAFQKSIEAAQTHFIRCLMSGAPFLTEGEDYIKTMALVFAAYKSASTGEIVNPHEFL